MSRRYRPVRTRLVVAAASVAVILAAVVQPSAALDQGDMGVMSPEKTHIKKDFPPIPGVYPHQGPTGHPFSAFRPFGCATYNYCSRHTFQVFVPKGYIESFKGSDIVSYGIKISLTWADPKGNDVDLFVWPDDDPALGAPSGPCASPPDKECEKTHPETYNIVEVKPEDDETTEDVDEAESPVTIYMSVVNHTGVNTGYTLDLQWFLIPFGSFKEFVPPKNREISRPVTASRTPAPYADPKDSGNDQPDPSTKILIPGADGELVEQSLDFLASGNRLESEKTGTAPWVGIATAALSGLAVLTFAYFAWQRRRREGAI